MRSTCTLSRQCLISATDAKMASAANPVGADLELSTLPSDILRHIFSFLQDPDDIASCHLVDTRCTCALTCRCRHHVRHMLLGCCWNHAPAFRHSVAGHIDEHKVWGAGSAPRQGRCCILQSRSTRVSWTWRCGTATRCATSTLGHCRSANWARTSRRSVQQLHMQAPHCVKQLRLPACVQHDS